MIVILAPVTANPVAAPDTVSVSPPSAMSSSVGVSVNVASQVVSPAGIVSVRSGTAA